MLWAFGARRRGLANWIALRGEAQYLIACVLPAGFASACTLISLIYVLGLVIIWLAPETKGRPLPE